MKTNSKRLIYILKMCIDFLWYANILVATVALGMLSYGFITNNFLEWSTLVHFPQHTVINEIELITDNVKDVLLKTSEATLTLQLKNSLFNMITSFFVYFAFEIILFSILFNLRKLFLSLDNGLSFTANNVISLKRIALFISLIFPLNLIWYLIDLYVLNSNISKIHNLSVQPDLDFEVLIIAAILYIVAEIFNNGLELKKENEEFV
jgi:hypothetical protein